MYVRYEAEQTQSMIRQTKTVRYFSAHPKKPGLFLFVCIAGLSIDLVTIIVQHRSARYRCSGQLSAILIMGGIMVRAQPPYLNWNFRSLGVQTVSSSNYLGVLHH